MKKYGFKYQWFDDYKGDVNECDIEHVTSKMKEGYVEGGLCSVEDDGATEHSGWWKSIKNSKR